MKKVKIFADSTCDLSEDLLHKFDISILPLLITMGGNSLRDGLEVTPEEIYKWSDETKETPKTAAPMIGDAIDYFKPFMDEGLDIIFFGISSSMSTTCNMVKLLAENLDYPNLHVVDSKSLSTGIGLQVIRAAKMAMGGSTVEEILEDNKKINSKVRASFVVDNLTFLHRGGRCSAVANMIANTLRVKQEIVVKDGKMDVAKRYRGSQKSVILKYVKDKKEELFNAETDTVFITHSGCPDEVLENVERYIKELEILIKFILLEQVE